MCLMVGDVSLVARTLSKHGVSREKAREMLGDIYNTPDEPSRILVEKLTDFSYKHKTEPKGFAYMIQVACLHGKLGNMIGIDG